MSDEAAAAPATPNATTPPPAAPGAAAQAAPPAPAQAEGGAPPAPAPAPAAPVVPEKYDLKLPDGSPLDPSRVEKIAALAKERGLSNEAAQELLTGEHELLAEHVEKQKANLVSQAEAWKAQLAQDPEIGGEKLAENVELAKRVINKYGDDQLKKALDDTGLGNYPGLVKLFTKIGREMAPDKLVITDNSGGEKKSIEERLYGSTK